jgi:hypothetical protein
LLDRLREKRTLGAATTITGETVMTVSEVAEFLHSSVNLKERSSAADLLITNKRPDHNRTH